MDTHTFDCVFDFYGLNLGTRRYVGLWSNKGDKMGLWYKPIALNLVTQNCAHHMFDKSPKWTVLSKSPNFEVIVKLSWFHESGV